MLNKTKTYKDLILWKNAFETTLLVVKLIRKLPQDYANKIIINQLLRAVMSIGANIAEGYGRYSKREFSRFLQVSLGSANETEYWLMVLKEANPNFDLEIEKVIQKNIENIKMLASSIKTLRNKH